ncbi:MAG TPA: hypothetical protein VH704_13945 [Casimicrobiaceae bacterium]|nr:hypothetical protein [Casimicrobiaceae bacterium]
MSTRAEGSAQGRSRAIRQEADERVPILHGHWGGRPMSARAEGSAQGRSSGIRQEADVQSVVLRPAIKEADR